MMNDENRNRYEAMADADFEGIQVLLGTNEPWWIVGALQFILGSVLSELRAKETA